MLRHASREGIWESKFHTFLHWSQRCPNEFSTISQSFTKTCVRVDSTYLLTTQFTACCLRREEANWRTESSSLHCNIIDTRTKPVTKTPEFKRKLDVASVYWFCCVSRKPSWLSSSFNRIVTTSRCDVISWALHQLGLCSPETQRQEQLSQPMVASGFLVSYSLYKVCHVMKLSSWSVIKLLYVQIRVVICRFSITPWQIHFRDYAAGTGRVRPGYSQRTVPGTCTRVPGTWYFLVHGWGWLYVYTYAYT